ncbi:MAG TPA: hypothetical protein VFT80_01690, partial [Actinomycetota bacterium]|nr:hypothetical protein [Actinomycetota bacterium]
MGHVRRPPAEPGPRLPEVGRIGAAGSTSRARALARALSVGLLVTACTRGTAPPADRERAEASPPGPTPSASAAPVAPSDGGGDPAGDPVPTVPEPDERIPRDPRALAERLTAQLRALDAAIRTWRRDGEVGVWPPPSEVELRTLYVQRAIRTMGHAPHLARRTVERLPRAWRFEVRANVSATVAL